VIRGLALSENTWVRVDFLAMEVKLVGKRVWRMEVAFMRAVLARVFMIAISKEVGTIDTACMR
jgi:hypothetical protein